ncbi:hypothetical protein IW01_07595 [Pectobacterium brasiliense]|uniref:hypothetical protein n=1 Tax=Pectobacterium brasiliense TaxID=180957 RepID=UPI0004E6C3AE|nr:hypothetical protein [Pectobacterium brasiliense]KFF71788.1 hypothetical protein IW01_07595 [Pectobacterium brasiliense]
MTVESALKIVKKYSIQSLVVIVLCIPIAIYFITEYKSLQALKDAHNEDVNKFYEKTSAKEKDIIQKQGENYKKEIYLEQMKKEYESKFTELDNLKKGINTEYSALAAKEKELTDANQKRNASEKLQVMISEFSSFGVNLSHSPKCDDGEEKWKRYNMANAKLREAEAHARANGLYDSYKGFFISNAPFLISGCG